MKKISKESDGTGTEKKECILSTFGVNTESDDEECKDTSNRLRDRFSEKNHDDTAREREEKYDGLLKWVAKIARDESGGENEEGREKWENIFEKCVEIDMRSDAKEIGEGEEEWA